MRPTSTGATGQPADSRAAAAPREQRFNDIFAATRARVLAYALRRAPEAEDAADVVAETYLIAWRRLDDVPGGAGTVPWLLGTARRVLANHRRGTSRRLALADRLREELAVQAAATRPGSADSADPTMIEALAALPDKDREVLLLNAWDDLSPAEIAWALGESPGAVRVRLFRARRRIRELLRPSHEMVAEGGQPARDHTAALSVAAGGQLTSHSVWPRERTIRDV